MHTSPTTITRRPNWKLAIGLPATIFLACIAITFTTVFKNRQTLLSNAIVVDLLVSAPLVYLLAIRKTAVSKATVARVFVIGLLLAGWLVSTKNNNLLHVFKTWVSPVVEGLVIFFIIKKFRAANKVAKQGNNSVDFLLHCRNIMKQVLGNEKVGNIISCEIAVLYYAFAGRKARNIDHQTRFSNYKDNGILLVLGAVLFLLLTEAIGMHFLFMLWNKTLAWTLFGLSVYTCLQLFAHIRAVKARPICIKASSLEIHNGLAGDAIIELCNIERIELNNKVPAGRLAMKIALLKGLENHNCIVYLKQTMEATKLFGMKQQTDAVMFHVDKPKEFMEALQQKLTG